ncbi:MAG: efflux RND transporter periplasmic adaptor subunit [Beijerinckiaceae bacterium]|jgi:membrane fusion protein, multidrug efflux system|nr:efflux RND transporter periplasmic adaptor subunit [Beijerinckiaceae bacterium]
MARRYTIIIIGVILLAVGFAYWQRQTQANAPAKPQAAAPAQPPAEVGVVTTERREVQLPVTYAGRVAGYRDVEIRAQVSGILLERSYEDGAKVEQGQVLFRIDSRPYEVARDRARAQLAQAEATLRQAEENYKRIEELARKQVSSEQAFEQARATRDQAQAGVQLAQSEVKNAELNIGYSTVRAPVSGTTALQSPPVGSLIQAQSALLTTLTQLDPAYVYFSVTDTDFQNFRTLNGQRAKPINESDLEVELQYGNGATYPARGKVQVSASSVDTRTGTIQVRAIFANADGQLLPGQFVRLVVRGLSVPNSIVLPKQSISQGPQGPFVYVVGDNNVAQARPVKLGQEIAEGWIVQSGLEGGERIVVDGIIRVRPGATVKPVPWTAKSAEAPGAAK